MEVEHFSARVQANTSVGLSFSNRPEAVPLQLKEPTLTVKWFLTSLATMGVII
jgi:hypothetical protein